MFKISHIIYILIIAALLTSCHTARKAGNAALGSTDGDWSNVYASANISLEKPMEMSFSSRVTMQRGEYIHLSMRFIGMEVVAVYMNSDSLYFVDKYHKYLFAEPNKAVLGENYSNLTINDIQDVILGKIQLPETDRVAVVPANFVETPAGNVASDLSLFSDTPYGTIEGKWAWSPRDAKWNDPTRTVNFKMPGNYRRIQLENLKSLFKSLIM